MTNDDRTRRAIERAEKVRRSMQSVEEGPIGIMAALGRESFTLTPHKGWPTKSAMLEMLAAAAAGTMQLEGMTKGMAQAAHDFISKPSEGPGV